MRTPKADIWSNKDSSMVNGLLFLGAISRKVCSNITHTDTGRPHGVPAAHIKLLM